MEALLRNLIEQNERLIAAVEAVGERIEHFENEIRGDLALANSSSSISSIDETLSEVAGALEIIGDGSILKNILDEISEVRSAVEILDSTVRVEAEELKK